MVEYSLKQVDPEDLIDGHKIAFEVVWEDPVTITEAVDKLQEMKEWCADNLGKEFEDWRYQYKMAQLIVCFRELAGGVFFKLVWGGYDQYGSETQ